jgi:hypothetical protein
MAVPSAKRTSWRRGRGSIFWLRAASLALIVSSCTEPAYLDPDASEAGKEEVVVPGDASAPEASMPPDAARTPLCESPACGPTHEAGMPEDASADADAAPSEGSGLDAVRQRWAGRYATRSYLFAYSAPLETASRLLTLAEIKPTVDGGLVLEEELCLFEGEWSFFFTGHLRVEFKGAHVSSPMTFDDQRFSSMQAKASIGYGPAPSGCTAGVTSVEIQPDQVWLGSMFTCDCPRNADVPTSIRDCRLTNEDGDDAPGFTFNLTLAGSSVEFHVAQEERLRLINGYRVGERLYADREFLDTTKVIDCTIDNVDKPAADCPLGGASKTCPTNTHKTELVRIEPNLGCREIMEREAGLFLSPAPAAFPSSCRM